MKASSPVVLVVKNLYFGFPAAGAQALKHVGILYNMYDF
jgi:hypothetical protein